MCFFIFFIFTIENMPDTFCFTNAIVFMVFVATNAKYA
jgi:hypothetical protein